MSTQREEGRVAPHPTLTEYYGNDAARRERVRSMFDASAAHYNWVTGLMSFGSGDWYRKEALKRAGLAHSMQLLDVGAGTGSVSRAGQAIVGEDGLVIAVDPSPGMLREAANSGVRRISRGYGEALPFADDRFDFLSMGYALRHVADLRNAFAEYYRVLKPGAKVLLLEITPPVGRLRTALLRFYMRSILPNAAFLLRRSADTQELMRYYWDTIEQCVPPDVIINELKTVGFRDVNRYVELGIFSEYTGVKPT